MAMYTMVLCLGFAEIFKYQHLPYNVTYTVQAALTIFGYTVMTWMLFGTVLTLLCWGPSKFSRSHTLADALSQRQPRSHTPGRATLFSGGDFGRDSDVSLSSSKVDRSWYQRSGR